ncbi:tRNA (5-methylaminomethyl-2-thiouridylate)-methyltransferase / FAD-dependent cmnm(5)s(2)U34 oxidoreductase [hydrothermal vent metagenome]|uniref:tRNA (5-methylaminomethyl-2-thiouridylate)-methyltransferase / FAD-dependent cmnm(5)s(2)U34 oxidoreductase n=1 Tax=hydrothermal vent metagenome TaxID=652676 RepID=A0A3B0XRN2_9ZZZZ
MNYAKPDWRDGQPYSPDFDDVYFSVDNGLEETEHVFIQHNQLLQRFSSLSAQNNVFVIAETGFGSGLNFLLSVKHWLEIADTSACLYYYSVENTPFTPDDMAQAHTFWPELKTIADELQGQYQAASAGFHLFDLFEGRVKLVLMLGEVEAMLQQMQLPVSGKVDTWFLDGFAPSLNPDMWSDGVFSQIARLSRVGSTFSTYTAAGIVKRGLLAAGFTVRKVSGCARKRHNLCGELEREWPQPYPNQPWYTYPELKPDIPTERSVCIVGAGIAGLTTAWSLVKRGFQVEVIDAGEQLGAQASGNPRAMLMPRLSLQNSADAEFYLAAYFYALRCLQQLDEQQISWQQTGGMQLATSQRIKKQLAEYPQDKALAQVLDASAASQLSGLKIEGAAHYFPLGACVYPLKILQRLIDDMGDRLSIRYNCTVRSFDYRDQQWWLKDEYNESVAVSGCLVLASAWQTRRFEQFNHLYLQPARGQLSLLRANRISQQLKVPVSYGGYLLPADNAKHVAGASFELDDCSVDLREREDQANFTDLNHGFEGLFKAQDICGGRVSVRAVTPDRTPVVGPAPVKQSYIDDYADLHKGKAARTYPLARYLPNLYVNTGHGARGFSSAFLSAQLLAATICDEPLPVSNRVRYALHPARFLIRSFKKKKI